MTSNKEKLIRRVKEDDKYQRVLKSVEPEMSQSIDNAVMEFVGMMTKGMDQLEEQLKVPGMREKLLRALEGKIKPE